MLSRQASSPAFVKIAHSPGSFAEQDHFRTLGRFHAIAFFSDRDLTIP